MLERAAKRLPLYAFSNTNGAHVEHFSQAYAGVLGHSFHGAVGIGAQDNGIDPAFDVVRDVAQLLARIEAARSLVHEESIAAHAGHSGFEGEAGAQRLFLEKHHHLLAGECGPEIRGTRLQQAGKMENGFDLNRAEIANRNQIASRKSRGSRGSRDLRSLEWLAAQRSGLLLPGFALLLNCFFG